MAASTSFSRAWLWPAETRIPLLANSRISPRAPGSSGASVISVMTSAYSIRGCTFAADGAYTFSGNWAPHCSTFKNGPSR